MDLVWRAITAVHQFVINSFQYEKSYTCGSAAIVAMQPSCQRQFVGEIEESWGWEAGICFRIETARSHFRQRGFS